MEYSIQEIGGSTIEIAFSLTKEEWNDCIKQIYEKNKHKYKVEGFRSGKVPYNLLVNRYGIEIFYEDSIDFAVKKYYQDILQKEEKYEPIESPEIDVKTISEDGLSIVLTVQFYPIFELGQYKDLILPATKTEITEDDINEEINRVRETHARWLGIDNRGIKLGDKIILDYEGSFDGIPFEGGSAQGASLEIGSGMFIPGFEEKLIDAKLNEIRDVEVTFPEDYHSELHAGKKAVFRCKILEIMEKELPILDDEFAKDLGVFETFLEYKESVKESLQEKQLGKDRVQEENAMLDAICRNTSIVLPDLFVEQELDRLINDFTLKLAYSGLSFEAYLGYLGTDLESFRKENRDEASETVKVRLILEAILKNEGITVEKEEVDAELKIMAEKEKKDFEEFTKDLKEDNIMRIMNKLVTDKLFDFLRNSNTFENKA